jgi:hypothetical protein
MTLEGCIYVVSSNLLFLVLDIIVLGVSLEAKEVCVCCFCMAKLEVKEKCRLLSQVSI